MQLFRMTSLLAVTILVLTMALPITNASAQAGPDVDLPAGVEAFLDGLSENPVVISPGQGGFEATFVRDAEGKVTSIDYTLIYGSLKSSPDAAGIVTQAHIHIGKPWENGEVVVPLCSSDTTACPPPTADAPATVTGTIVASDVQAAGIGDTADIIQAEDLQALEMIMVNGAAYVNVHSMAHPSGELRGVTFGFSADSDG